MTKSDPIKEQFLTPTQEDYLEAILELTEAKMVVRNMELADKLGVKRATVTRALKILTQKGMINHEMHGYVTLTALGREIASEILERHTLFKYFFKDILELPEEEADSVACKIEHTISGEALEKFRDFIKKLDKNQYKNRTLSTEKYKNR